MTRPAQRRREPVLGGIGLEGRQPVDRDPAASGIERGVGVAERTGAVGTAVPEHDPLAEIGGEQRGGRAGRAGHQAAAAPAEGCDSGHYRALCCPAGPQIMGDAERAVESMPGVGRAIINLVWAGRRFRRRLRAVRSPATGGK